jgi:hypothetical protein
MGQTIRKMLAACHPETNLGRVGPNAASANRTGLNPPTKLREMISYRGPVNRLAREMRQNAVGILLKKGGQSSVIPTIRPKCNSQQTAETKQS